MFYYECASNAVCLGLDSSDQGHVVGGGGGRYKTGALAAIQFVCIIFTFTSPE